MLSNVMSKFMGQCVVLAIVFIICGWSRANAQTATPYTSTIGDYAFTSVFPSGQLLLGEMKFPGDGTVTGKWTVQKHASSLQVCNDTVVGTVVKDDFLTNAFDMVLTITGDCRKAGGMTVSFRAEPYLGQTGFFWTAILNRYGGLVPSKGEAHAQLAGDISQGD